VVTICQVLESRQTLRVGDLLVFGCHAGECVIEVGRRALRDQSVEVCGISGSHTLRDGTAQRVAYADYVLERVATDFGVAQFLHQNVENFDLKRKLHDLYWVWVIGVSGTESIVCKSGVIPQPRLHPRSCNQVQCPSRYDPAFLHESRFEAW